jgi:hypothetical protein
MNVAHSQEQLWGVGKEVPERFPSPTEGLAEVEKYLFVKHQSGDFLQILITSTIY